MLNIGFDAKRFFLNHTGLGNYSRDFIRILETYYPENTYFKYTPKLPTKDITDKNIHLPQGLWTKLPMLWRNKGIVKDLKRDQIDIYHGLSGEIPVGLKKSDIKSVVTIHDLIFLRFPELYKSVDRWIYNKKAKYAVENSDKIIAISNQTKHDIINFYQIPANKIDVIYQVCHPAFKTFKEETAKDKIRQRYKLPENFILNVGSIEPRKNAFQIVKAIETIDIPLVIIGKETPYSDSIKKYVSAHNLESKVIFMKGMSMDELATIYAMASIFIYPSKFEGFGIPIIEALFSGTPVITNNSGVFPEAGGPNSCYIDPDNVDEIKFAIQSILGSNELQKEMSIKGLEYAQQFNDDVIASQIMTCYKSLK